MILDERLEFADALDVSAVAGTLLEGDVIDLGAVVRDIGQGQPLYLMIEVTTAFTSAGSSTTGFILASDSVEAIDNGGAATEHYNTGLIAKAVLVIGYRFQVALPMHDPAYERYLGILVETAVATTTAGSINAFLALDPAGWTSYPDGVN